MKTPMTKLMLAAVAATLLCLGARAANVDISTITSSGYMASDGDVLYGTLSKRYPIDIPDGVTVTLAGITYGDTIHCQGDAVIILQEDTVNTIQPGNPWPAIELWNYGKTLTIRGKGKLVAYGGGHNAAIGPCSPDNGWNRGEGGSLVIEGGDITAVGGSFGAGIGASANNNCGSIVIRGGSVTATGTSAYGIGSSASGTCDGVTIEGTVTKVVATGTIAPIGAKGDNVVIAQALIQTMSNNDLTLTIEPSPVVYDITWLDDTGSEIGVAQVAEGLKPTHAEPTKAAATPYRWVFTGWTPELEAAVSNTTYTATFKKVADLSLVESDWTAADGDEIVGEATHEVTIPGGAHVTINGVAVAGASGGAAVDAPEFADDGESVTTKFEKGEGDTWKITAFAEMSNESRGTDVTASQLKVYRASSLEGLKTAEAMTSGVTLTEKTSAVKVTLEAEAPADAEQQFFRVDFGE